MQIVEVWGIRAYGTIHGGYGDDNPVFLQAKKAHNERVLAQQKKEQ